ncbi:MAG: hypothetical protein NZ529_03715 [Cytophagaceae bacterium]|nr:hypothetical protein [Cytophagaceae bacterium]MDW8455878.1 hypothetical protein [Cytophagaceae bacterium]
MSSNTPLSPMYNIGFVVGLKREVDGRFICGCGVKSSVVSSKLPDWKSAGIPFCKLLRSFTFSHELEKFERTCARDGSHGRHGQCGALAEHRSESGVAYSPAPQGRALKKIGHAFSLMHNPGSSGATFIA